jgi:uncharacterized membrane protein YcaP (DUF421 family)
MLFDNFQGLLRVIRAGSLAYVAVSTVLRFSAKRTLAKMNAFDLVVTVALGSTLTTVLLTQDVALLEGILALAIQALLQFTAVWSVLRWPRIAGLVKARPRILSQANAGAPPAWPQGRSS